jgi:hypothetical protein
MADSEALSIAVVCEAPADQRTVCGIADRVLCSEIERVEADVLDSYRCWRGAERDEPHLQWREVSRRARKKNLKAHGHFSGEPGAPDARMARLALLLLYSAENRPDAILLIRDTDGCLDRVTGLNQARNSFRSNMVVVLATPHTRRECWVLAGFEPRDSREEKRLEELAAELGMDPRAATGGRRSTRNAKEVLGELTGNNFVREQMCWAETPLQTLEHWGRSNCLAEFIGEVRSRLVPLVARTAA